jgi:hypothetical protein
MAAFMGILMVSMLTAAMIKELQVRVQPQDANKRELVRTFASVYGYEHTQPYVQHTHARHVRMHK